MRDLSESLSESQIQSSLSESQIQSESLRESDSE